MGPVLSSRRGARSVTERRYPPDYRAFKPSPSKLLVNGFIYRDQCDHSDRVNIGRYVPYEIAVIIHLCYGDINIVFHSNDATRSNIENGDRTFLSKPSRWAVAPSSFHAPYLNTRSLHPRFRKGFNRGVHYLSVLCRTLPTDHSWEGHKCSLCQSTTTFIGVQSVPSRYFGNFFTSNDLQWRAGDTVTVCLNVNTKEVKWYNGTTLVFRRSFRHCLRDYRDCTMPRKLCYRFKMRIYPQLAHYELVETPREVMKDEILRL